MCNYGTSVNDQNELWMVDIILRLDSLTGQCCKKKKKITSQLDVLARLNSKSRINLKVLKSKFSEKEVFRNGFPENGQLWKDGFDACSE